VKVVIIDESTVFKGEKLKSWSALMAKEMMKTREIINKEYSKIFIKPICDEWLKSEIESGRLKFPNTSQKLLEYKK
jgi:hypothetical protein